MTVREIVALQGDRYSPNLRSWLTRERFGGATPSVYSDPAGTPWIGWIDEDTWFIGSRLWRVLTVGKKAEAGCWTFPISDLTERAGFWEQYAEAGRCAIDPEHSHVFIGEETRWTTDGDERTCNWCGCQQRLERWTEPRERQRWIPNPSTTTQRRSE